MNIVLLVGDNNIGKSRLLREVMRADPRIHGLDEFGDTRHPSRHEALIGYARSRAPFVAETHNPYLVDHVQYESVWVLAVAGDEVRGARLSDHPSADEWRTELKSGEFWSSVGEAWVVESTEAKAGKALVDAIVASATTEEIGE